MYSSSSASKTPSFNNYQMHKPQRDISPNRQRQKPHKYYSADQVSRMIKAYIQPKLNFLKNQLEERQKIISMLNKKLDQNDEKINNIISCSEAIFRQQKQYANGQNQQYSHIVGVVNQLLNDKLKQNWETVAAQLQNIRENYKISYENLSRNLEQRVQQEIESMKKLTSQYIQQCRHKNNNYWLKIKEALNRINSKANKIDESLLNVSTNFQKFKFQSSNDHQYINELQKSKVVIRKLVQLKKSVENIYQNYNNLLEVQNQFKNSFQTKKSYNEGFNFQQNNQFKFAAQNHPQRENHQNSAQLFDFNDSYEKKELHAEKAGNTFPMFKKGYQYIQQSRKKVSESVQDIALEYSREEQSNIPIRNQLKTDVVNEQEQFLPNKYFNPNTGNIRNGKQKNNANTASKQFSPNSKWENLLGSPNELSQGISCLNSTANAIGQSNSRSTSFVNLSLQHRHQMSESLKERLLQIIQIKKMEKPLLVFLDQINYLKNSQGNYLFDMKGNMFKLNKQQGRDLQRLGIIKFKQSGRKNLDESKIKQLKGVVHMNRLKNDSPQQGTPSKSKSVGIQRIKSIIIKQV